jgi:prepilin-type processing-associated H-X9-DG protein
MEPVMTDGTDVPESLAPTPARRNFMSCGGCVWIAAGVFLVLVVIASWLPMNRPYREVAQRGQCTNNLMKIGLALHSYSAKYGSFPPAYTVDKQGRRMHSWRALLLEFLDPDLCRKYDFSRPWNSPDNLAVAGMMKENGPYRCPTENPQNPLNTSYVMLVGPRAFSAGPTGRKPEEITDGPANTIAVVEMWPSGIGWTAPYDLVVSEMSFKINDPDRVGVRSCHPVGANVLFADAHVTYIGGDIDEKILKALCTINGKEDVSKFFRD